MQFGEPTPDPFNKMAPLEISEHKSISIAIGTILKDNKSAFSFTPEPLPDIGRSKKTPPLPADQNKLGSLVETDLRSKPLTRDQSLEYQNPDTSMVPNSHDTQSTTLASPNPRISWPLPQPSSEPTDLQKYINQTQRQHGLIQAKVDFIKKNQLPPDPKPSTSLKTPKLQAAVTRLLKKIDSNIIPEKKTIKTLKPPKPITSIPTRPKKSPKIHINASNSPKNPTNPQNPVSSLSTEPIIDPKRHQKLQKWLTKNSRKLTGDANNSL